MTMQEINWTPVLETDMPLNVMLNVLPTKGNLVYEYNPFRNYRLTKDKYWYDGKYYTLEELEKDCGITLNNDNITIRIKRTIKTTAIPMIKTPTPCPNFSAILILSPH